MTARISGDHAGLVLSRYKRTLHSVAKALAALLVAVLMFTLLGVGNAQAEQPQPNTTQNQPSVSKEFGVTAVRMNAFGYFEFEREIEKQITPHKFFGGFIEFDWRIPSWAKEGDYFTLKFDDSIHIEKPPMYADDEHVPYDKLDSQPSRYSGTPDNKLGVITTTDSVKEAGDIPILNMYYTKIGEVTFVVQKIANRKGAMSGEGTIGKPLDKSRLLAYSDSLGRHVDKEPKDLDYNLREVNDLKANKDKYDFYVGVTPNLRKFNVQNGARHLKDKTYTDKKGTVHKHDDYTFVRDVHFTSEYMGDGAKRSMDLSVQVNYRTFMLHIDSRNRAGLGKEVIWPIYEDRTHIHFDFIYNAAHRYVASGGTRQSVIQPLVVEHKRVNGRDVLDESRRSAFIDRFDVWEGDECQYRQLKCRGPHWGGTKYAPVPWISDTPLKTTDDANDKYDKQVHSYFGWHVRSTQRYNPEAVKDYKNTYNKLHFDNNNRAGQNRIIYAQLHAQKRKVVDFSNGFVGHGVRMNTQHAGDPPRYQDIFFNRTSSFGSGSSELVETGEEDSIKFLKVDENYNPLSSKVKKTTDNRSFILKDHFGHSYKKTAEGVYADDYGFSLKQRRGAKNALLFKDSLGNNFRLENNSIYDAQNKEYRLKDGTTGTYIAEDGALFYATRPELYLDEAKLKISQENGEISVYDERGSKLKVNLREPNKFQVLGRFDYSLLLEQKGSEWAFSRWVFDPDIPEKHQTLKRWDTAQGMYVYRKIGTWETLKSKKQGDYYVISGMNYGNVEVVPDLENPIEFALTHSNGKLLEKQPVDEYGYTVIKNYAKGEYKLQEYLPANSNYHGLPTGYKVNVQENGAVTITDSANVQVTDRSYPVSVLDVANRKYRVVNKPKTKIVVQKLDSAGKQIATAAATFKLYPAQDVTVTDSGATPKHGVKGLDLKTVKQPNGGQQTFGESAELFVDPTQKEWVLVETEPPAGYTKAKPVKLNLVTYGSGDYWGFRWSVADLSDMPRNQQGWYAQGAAAVEKRQGVVVSVKNTKALQDVQVTYTAHENRIYSTDRYIEGTGVPGATVTVRDGEAELGSTQVNSEGKWRVQLSRGVAATYKVDRIEDKAAPVKTPSRLTVEQRKDGAISSRLPVGVELGATQIQPFSHGNYEPNKLIAGQKHVVLNVPHDAGLVYVKINDRVFEITRNGASKHWSTKQNGVVVASSTDSFSDTLTLTFNDPAFVLQYDENKQNNNIKVVPYLGKGETWSDYPAKAENLAAIKTAGQDVEENKWITRPVTNEKPKVAANSASFAYGSTVTLQQILKLAQVTDEEDDINPAVVVPQVDKKKILVTQIVSAGQATAYDESQQNNIQLTAAGKYTVTFKAVDSQGLESDPAEAEIEIGVPKLTVTPTNGKTGREGRIYSTDSFVAGAGGYPGAALTVTQGNDTIGTGTVNEDGSWRVTLTKGAVTNYIPNKRGNNKQPDGRLTVKTPAELEITQNKDGATGEVTVGVELGSSQIEPFNKQNIAPTSVVAGQKELVLKVPHDAGIVYVQSNGNQVNLTRSKDDLQRWQVALDPTSAGAAGVEVTTELGAFHDTIKLQFADHNFVLTYNADSSKDKVRIVSQLYAGDRSWSLYATNPAKKTEITNRGESVEERWITRPVTNNAPVVLLSNDGMVTVSTGSVANEELTRKGAYAKYTDAEDDIKPEAVVKNPAYSKIIVTKIAQGAVEKPYNLDTQDQAKLDSPGKYSVTFKAYDSQGLLSANEVTKEFIVTHNAPTAVITPTVSGQQNSVLSTDSSISGTGARVGSRVVVKNADGKIIGTSAIVGDDGEWTVQLSEPLTNTGATSGKKPKLYESFMNAAGEPVETVTGTEFDVVFGHAFMEPFAILKDTTACTSDAPGPDGKPNDKRRSCLAQGQKELFVNVPHDAKAFALRGLRDDDKEAQGVSFFLQDDGSWSVKYGKNPGRGNKNKPVEDDKTITVKTVRPGNTKDSDGMFVTRIHLEFQQGADAFRVKKNPVRFYAAYTANNGTGVDATDIDTNALNYFQQEFKGQGRCDDSQNRGMYCYTPVNEAPQVKLPEGKQNVVDLLAGANVDNAALVRKGEYVTYADREDDTGLIIGAEPALYVSSIKQGENTTNFSKDNQANAAITKPGVYEVGFKAVDSQGAESEEFKITFRTAASLSVKTVDELAQNVVKGAVLTLYADTNNNKKFDEGDKIVDGAAEQIIADGAKQPAKWDALPAGSYFVNVVPQSDSRYQERVYFVEHKAENDNDAVTVPLQRASSEVGWEKVDSADTSKYLGGSKWCVKPPQGVSFAQLNVSTEATGECADGVIVEDLEGAAAPGDEAAASDAGDAAAGGVQDINALPARVLKDVNPEKGKIAISLPWMNSYQSYTVKEHEAPVLYSKSDTVYQVYVSSAQTEKVEFVKDGYIVAQTAVNGQTKWHKITNERIPQVGVLLDSGVRYLLWALLVAGAAGVWFVVSARRRAAQAARLD